MNNYIRTISIFVILLISTSCSNDDDSSPKGIDSRIQGTWLASATTRQYLDLQGMVVEEESHPDGDFGEISFNNGVFTHTETGYSPYSGTYQTNFSSGKEYIVLSADGNSSTLEVQFPANNQMILIFGDGKIVGGEQNGFSFRNHVTLTKR